MQIPHFYIIESQSITLSFGMTNRRQITIDSVWINKIMAQKYLSYMKALKMTSTTYKIKKLKINEIKNIYAFVSRNMTICFNYDSISQYGEMLKDEYYNLPVASGHLPVSPTGYVNKTYYETTGEETLAENYTFFTNAIAISGTPIINFYDICQSNVDKITNMA